LDVKLEKPLTLYCGFDPTAESLHIGSLLPITLLKRFEDKGHRPIFLLGGSTGLVGDPSYKTDERKLSDSSMVLNNIESIKQQLSLYMNPQKSIFLNNIE